MDDALAVSAVKPVRRTKAAWAWRDSWTLIKRSILHIVKSPDQLMAAAFQPIMFTVLFVYIFGGSIHTGTSYINFLMAGILIQTAAFGATYTAIGVATDMKRGIIDRFKSLPMLSSAVLIGHTMADLVRNYISSAIMIGVGLALGFRPHASVTDWILIAVLLGLFTLAFSWLFAILGLVTKSIEAVQWLSFVFIFPLTFASSAFVQTSTLPKYLRIFADNQPVSHVIDAIRSLLLGTPMGNDGWWAAGWSIAIILVCVPIAGYLFRHSSSK